MKHHDNKFLEKEFEWDMIDDSNCIDIGGGVDFDAEVKWRKNVALNPIHENILEAHFGNFFPRANDMLNFLMSAIILEGHHSAAQLKKRK